MLSTEQEKLQTTRWGQVLDLEFPTCQQIKSHPEIRNPADGIGIVVRPGAEWVFTIAYELAFLADAAFHQRMSPD